MSCCKIKEVMHPVEWGTHTFDHNVYICYCLPWYVFIVFAELLEKTWKDVEINKQKTISHMLLEF